MQKLIFPIPLCILILLFSGCSDPGEAVPQGAPQSDTISEREEEEGAERIPYETLSAEKKSQINEFLGFDPEDQSLDTNSYYILLYQYLDDPAGLTTTPLFPKATKFSRTFPLKLSL